MCEPTPCHFGLHPVPLFDVWTYTLSFWTTPGDTFECVNLHLDTLVYSQWQFLMCEPTPCNFGSFPVTHFYVWTYTLSFWFTPSDTFIICVNLHLIILVHSLWHLSMCEPTSCHFGLLKVTIFNVRTYTLSFWSTPGDTHFLICEPTPCHFGPRPVTLFNVWTYTLSFWSTPSDTFKCVNLHLVILVHSHIFMCEATPCHFGPLPVTLFNVWTYTL